MGFDPGEEQRLIRKTAYNLAKDHFEDKAFEWGSDYPWENAKILANHDLLTLNLPEEYGGGGMSTIDVIMAMEGIGRVCQDSTKAVQLASFGPPRAIAEFGSEKLKEKYLPPITEGESLLAIAISEPDAGSHATAMSTRAEKDENELVINGQKAWVSETTHADAFLTYVVFPDGHIGSVIVEKGDPGFTVGKPEMNMAGHPQSQLYFDDTRIPKNRVLLSGADAFRKQITAYNLERIGACAKVWIAAKWAFEEALEYAQTREQFGQPIIEFQAVGHRLADMAMDLQASRYLIYQAITNDDLPSRLKSSITKAFVTEKCQKIADAALQIKGAAGYVGDTPESFIYRYIRGFQIASGTNDIHRTMITRSLKREGFPE